MTWRRAVGLLVASVIGAAGCGSTTVAGAPAAVAPTSSAGATSSVPARPADLPLEGVQPCELLTADQRVQLQMNRPPMPSTYSDLIAACSISSTLRGGTAIAADRQRGAEYFLTDTVIIHGDPIMVGDYPATMLYNKADQAKTCFVNIDVADGQNLSIQYSQPDGPGQAVLCPIAEEIALAALTTLRARP